MEYLITLIKFVNDKVKITVETAITKTLFVIRLNDYLENNYRLNQQLTEKDIDELNRLHGICFAYNKCLNKLSNKDYSYKEIKDVINTFDIDDNDKNELLKEFVQAGLINDYQLVINVFSINQQKGIGKRKTAQILKKRGIKEDIINNQLVLIDDNIEIENGIKLANNYYKTLSNDSYNFAKLKVKKKLVTEGFSDNISEIIQRVDLPFNKETQYNNLDKAYQKALRLYTKKYKGKELKNHLFNNLYSKGYSSSEITSLLEKEMNDNED